jgi:fructoselysine-6-P-deglycase FrlB-like protein
MIDPAADRPGAFLADILSAPDELAAVLDAQRAAIRDLPLGVAVRPTWRFVGMGSSRFAALDAAACLRAAGRDAHAELASAAGGSPGGRDSLVIAISASGRTKDVLAAAERYHRTSFVLAVTARPTSPLATSADAVVPLIGARNETAGIASRTYRATVSALALLVAEAEPALEPSGIDAAVPALAALVAGRDAWLGAAADALDGGRVIHVLGDGLRSGALEQAALMLREGPRLPAIAFDTGDWLHSGLYTLCPGDPVLLFAGSASDDEALATIRARGGVVVAVGAHRSEAHAGIPLPAAALTDAVVRALVEPAVAELLAAELWSRTGAREVSGPGAD